MRRLTATLAAPLAASALLLAGCSSSTNSTTSTGTTSAAAADTIVIKNFAFSPATLTVAPGTKVTVMNEDSVTHTLTSTASPHAFDTGDIAAGATMTFTAPGKAGSYPYICTIHTYMHGTLTVS
ncbi:cupredoxin domain-containing protein [Actinospica sp. MGRD01-02]|uniref:Cupredoxin domain-containing protein n=1 Tax=Actinospica acidithermotolerans TaxID=2828514 RepID=A0A941EBE4_9ACTN|nr:cupredoxin domain-containing protein [Actinospica acidithermotolerans]MBR7827332.1 cupredoxin domain-containing protein [Actinospica acidithermotolerans]